MNDGRPSPPEESRFEHAYDGIEEYDNPMPRWWVLIFWATIVYSVVYFANVVPGIGEGEGRLAQYETDVARADKQYARFLALEDAPGRDYRVAVSYGASF